MILSSTHQELRYITYEISVDYGFIFKIAFGVYLLIELTRFLPYLASFHLAIQHIDTISELTIIIITGISTAPFTFIKCSKALHIVIV